MRIISTVPSQTELLSYLGLDDEIIGITKFCVYPEKLYRTKTRIGGTKTLDIPLIRSLKPELILANKEENIREQIEELAEDLKVYTSEIEGLSAALKMIEDISSLTHKSSEGRKLIREIRSRFNELRPLTKPISTLYLIWREPYMSVGQDTFIHDMMMRCGFINVLGDSTRYPEVNPEIISPELILLSSEPFPFSDKHVHELQALFPEAQVCLVDGTYYSWYGSRLLDAPAYFQSIIDAVRP